MKGLIWADIFVIGSVLAILFIYQMRVRGQRNMDRDQLTYELVFPPGLNLAGAARFFTALDGLFGRLYRGPIVMAQRTMTLEFLATSTGLHHLITVPSEVADAARKHLRGVMPDLKMTEIARQPRSWRKAAQVRLTDSLDPAKSASYIPVVLQSLANFANNEAALTQIVVTGEPGGGFWATARAATTAATDARAAELMKALRNAYSSLHVTDFRPLPARLMNQVHTRRAPVFEWPHQLVPETLAIAFAMPMGGAQVSGLKYNQGRKHAPDHAIRRDGRLIAEANFAGAERPLAMAPEDRAAHMLVVGPTGSGKSTFLENIMAGDIADGEGFAYIDPKGDSVARLLDLIPRHRIKDVVLFDVTDLDHPVGFNILAGERPDRVAGQLVVAFDKLFDLTSSTPRAVDVLRSTLMTLAQGGYTIIDVPLMLDAGPRGQVFRDRVTAQTTHPELLDFWTWFDNLSTREQAEVSAPIIRRLRPLLLYPELRATFGQTASGFDLASAIRQRKIILVPLQSAQLHEQARLVGTLFLNALWNAIRTAGHGDNFYLYVDEFREVANLPVSYGQLFEQARGYKMPIIAATQDVSRFNERDRKDLMNNTRTKAFFQPAASDLRLLAAEMGHWAGEDDLSSLGPRELMMRFSIDGSASPPVTGRAYPPPTAVGLGNAVRAASRSAHGRTMTVVEAEIATRQNGAGRVRRPSKTPVNGSPASVLPQPAPDVIGWEPWEEDDAT
ncbi:type IV secretory system conjugative DNA transfer family protein [Streptomyces hokutonensis]|uniref:type IV secretory system conjugative DNA transfer family protein n=1 Tax=Streptomyces hokutonensis TaxID=1306990 RepID=UPI00382368FA